MKQFYRAFFFIFAVTVAGKSACATAQYGDLLIIGKDTVWITANPLEIYFQKKGERLIAGVEMRQNCTALWRGYVATWKLEKNRLYLVRVQTDYCGDNPTEIDIATEFGTKKVFASWMNDMIVRPKGKLLQYVHMGYESIYEEEIYYSFKNGILAATKKFDYLQRDKRRIFPGQQFLMDTIKKKILRLIDDAVRAGFSEDSACFINVEFNEEGRLSFIGVGFNQREPATRMEKEILQTAKKALRGFPRLMKVTHERYHPPSIEIYFSGHCLKHPRDRRYGCDDE